MLDNHFRIINYLRLSVTDRCNLRCIYCMPEEGIRFIPHDEILTYEEMRYIVNLCIRKGIRKVRLTGGEPLVRKDIPIKINMVALKGINEDEIIDFARLTCRKPYHVRFIELMSVGEKNAWTAKRFISIKEIQDRIRSLGQLDPVHSRPLDGPADRYRLKGAKGEIGLIGVLSHHFCENCNRLRLRRNNNRGLRGDLCKTCTLVRKQSLVI